MSDAPLELVGPFLMRVLEPGNDGFDVFLSNQPFSPAGALQARRPVFRFPPERVQMIDQIRRVENPQIVILENRLAPGEHGSIPGHKECNLRRDGVSDLPQVGKVAVENCAIK